MTCYENTSGAVIYETNGYEKMRWAGYDGDDPVFDVLSGVSDGRWILQGAQETGSTGSIGGVSMANGAVYTR